MLADELSPVWQQQGYEEEAYSTTSFEDFWPDLVLPNAEPAYFTFENVSFDCPPQQQYPQQFVPQASPWSQCIQDQPAMTFAHNHNVNNNNTSYDSSFTTSSDSEIELSQEDTAQPKNAWSHQQYYMPHPQQPVAYQHVKTEELEPVAHHHHEPFAAVVDNMQQTQPVESDVSCMDVDDPVGFKLPASKTPIMEAMVVCAINNWGISVVKSTPTEVIFRVTDFNRYYRVSRAICSKHRPTEDIGSRVKSLRRWFINFPKKKDRQENPSFLLSVKPNTCKKVHGLIERNTKLLRKRQGL